MCYNYTMNDMDYLSQIAQDNRTVKKEPLGKFPIDLKWLKIIGAGVIGVILIMIVGSMLGGLGNKERDLVDQIYARTRNLNQSISEYGSKVKSSELRSMGNSLSNVLTETNSKVGALLASEYGTDGTDPRDEATTTSEDEHIAEVNTNLNYGWLNGMMDRYFVMEITREITLLMSLETELTEKTSSDPVKSVLVNSWNNLNQLETQFANYENSTN